MPESPNTMCLSLTSRRSRSGWWSAIWNWCSQTLKRRRGWRGGSGRGSGSSCLSLQILLHEESDCRFDTDNWSALYSACVKKCNVTQLVIMICAVSSAAPKGPRISEASLWPFKNFPGVIIVIFDHAASLCVLFQLPAHQFGFIHVRKTRVHLLRGFLHFQP